MTLDVYRRRDRKRCRTARVWLDGVEVTSRCFYVDTRRGVVRLYKVNSEGKKYLGPQWAVEASAHWAIPPHLLRVQTEERRGSVRIWKVAT